VEEAADLSAAVVTMGLFAGGLSGGWWSFGLGAISDGERDGSAKQRAREGWKLREKN
jgi:hypothetical protein